MNALTPQQLDALDAKIQEAARAKFVSRISGNTGKLLALPQRVVYPFLGKNPFTSSTKGVLPALAGLGGLSYLAGGSDFASPILSGMASLGSHIAGTKAPNILEASSRIASLSSPGLELSRLPFRALFNHMGLAAPSAAGYALAAAPLVVGALASGAHRLYSRAGQAKRLATLANKLHH